ncbi:MAG: PAS domain-containing sensor histidine kinase [Bryobacteraceae bacterium]
MSSRDAGKTRWLEAFHSASPAKVLTAAFLVQALILVVDAATLDQSLGVLYVLPMLLASLVLRKSHILTLALVLAVIRGLVTTYGNVLETALRFSMALVAYGSTGLLVNELVSNRKRAQQHLAEIRLQQQLRREAEEQLRLLAESSPAAILTLDQDGRVLSANEATRSLLGTPKGQPVAELQVCEHLPVLREALLLDPGKGRFRTAVQAQGRRMTGEPFTAQIWFSLYETPGSRRLAAIAVDISDEIRDREEQGLAQLVENNRIVASAISHEIRNVCAAASMLYKNLGRIPELAKAEDFHALGNLITAMEGIAGFELRQRGQGPINTVDLCDVLAQFRVIVQPAWDEANGALSWSIPDDPMLVQGTSYGLMQALLNLSQNSLRAAHDAARPEFGVAVERVNGTVKIAVTDSGPGPQEPVKLFQPFQPDSDHTGLGLYISRSIVRGYGGDLRYEPTGGRCCFVVELRARNENS